VAAIEQACAKICRRLQPHLQQKGSTWETWQATVTEVQEGSGVAPASVMLSAYGFYDGMERDKDGRTTKGGDFWRVLGCCRCVLWFDWQFKAGQKWPLLWLYCLPMAFMMV